MISHQHHGKCTCFCAINDNGVDLLRRGRLREAANLLAVGLKEIRATMAAAQANGGVSCYTCSLCHDSHPENTRHDVLSRQPVPSLTRDTIPSSPSSSLSRKRAASSSDDESHIRDSHDESDQTDTRTEDFVFSCPIAVPAHFGCKNVPYDQICFFMIYNIALSCDHLSLSNHPNAQKYSQVALSFYQLAYQVQAGSRLQVSMIYICGMLNNMARLHRLFQQESSARRCLEDLMSIVMYTTMARRRGRPSDDDDEEEANHAYYLNQFLNSALSSVMGPSTTTAGAA